MKAHKLFSFFLLFPLFLMAYPSGEELDIEVKLLPTAQFNLSDWNDPSINLWTVTLHNKTDHDTLAFIEFRMDVSGVSGLDASENPVVWGVTSRIDLPPNGVKQMFSADFGEGSMKKFIILDEFRSIIETKGYLPAGKYDLKMLVWTGTSMDYSIWGDWDEGARTVTDNENNSLLDISWDSEYVYSDNEDGYDGSWSWGDDYDRTNKDGSNILENVLVNTINIQEPVVDANVIDPYPWFRWDSPGFRNGVKIDYRLKISQFNPELHSSYTDALEDANSVFFDSDWSDQYSSIYHVIENGTPQQINIQFPSGDRDLACGYQYVWQVEAREYLDDGTITQFDMEGFRGVWGWPEPIKSSIYVFNFGSRLTKDNISSPTDGSNVNSVLPSFNWDAVNCADEYELWLSNAVDDPEVENPFFQSEPIQSLPFQYPFDAPGLMPGKRYAWKVRYNPNGEISPWSDVMSFTVGEMELTEPGQDDVLNTVLPLFNADIPNDVSGLELRISDMEDENVEMANIYSEVITGLPFQYPRDAVQGLFPGQKYYWKLMILDANDNVVGLPDDYNIIGSFAVAAINYLTPDQNEAEVLLQPIFSWEGPAEVANYELSLSDEYDPDVQNPFISFSVSGTFFQYPVDADIPLEYDREYYWNLRASDESGNLSEAMPPRKFRTQAKPLKPAPDMQINGLTEECPCEDDLEFSIMWTPVAESEYYHFIVSDNSETDEEGLLAERLYEIEDLNLTSITLGYEQVNFEYGMPYFIQVVAMKGEETHSYPAEVQSLNWCRQKGMESQPEFHVESSLSDPRLLNLYLDTDVDCVTEYVAVISTEADMSNILLESDPIQTFPYNWEATVDNLEFMNTYYLQLRPLKDGEIYGLLSEVVSASVAEEPGSVDIPEVNVTLSADRAVCPQISFNQVANAQSTRLTVSFESEIDDNGVLLSPLYTINDIRQTNINLCDLDVVLDYETDYFLQIQGERDGEAFGMPSTVTSFRTLARPGASDKFEFSITASSVDPCSYTLNLLNAVAGSESYYLEFAESPELDVIALTLSVESFPVNFTVEGRDLMWDTPYYVRGQAILNDLSHGIASDIITFSTCAQPGSNSRPEISLQPGSTDPRRVEVSLLNDVENADEYRLIFASESDMSGVIYEEILSASGFPFTVSSDMIEYSSNYHVALQGLMDGEDYGLLSVVQSLSIPAKPGSDEQPALYIQLAEGALIPTLELTNLVTGASSYIISIASDAEMSNILYEFEVSGNAAINYPDDAPQPDFGELYYFRIQAYADGSEHGLRSSVFSLYIPPVVPPQPSDTPYNWTESTPSASQYLLEVSATEDFNDPIINEIVMGTNYPFSMEGLKYNSGYFWRIRGLRNDGSWLGDHSTTAYFATEEINGPDLLNPVSVETSLQPEFSWIRIDQAASYELMLSSETDFSALVWSNRGAETNIKYPESALKLEHSSSYYWKVNAYDANDQLLSSSSPAAFTTEAPLVVSGLSPDGRGVEDLTPLLTWTNIQTASAYLIRLSAESDMSNILHENENSENSYRIGDGLLENDKTYYWNVTALDGSGNALSAPSSTADFTTPSLTAVTLLSPLNTSIGTTGPEIKWSTFSGASSYLLQLSADAEFGELIVDAQTEANSYQIEANTVLDYDNSYFWKVTAFDGNGGLLSESSLGEFRVANLPIPVLKSPGNAAEISAATPVFSWEKIENAAAYEMNISQNEDMSESRTYTSSELSFTYRDEANPLAVGQRYYWRLRAINSESAAVSRWGVTRHFTRSQTLPVELQAPGSGEQVSTRQPRFEWLRLDAGDNYEIQISADESFSELVWTMSGIPESNVLYPSRGAAELEIERSYFWRVRALKGEQALTQWSALFQFQVSLDMIPELISPVNSVAESITPKFSWNPVEGAHHYEMQLALDGGMTQLFHTESQLSSSQYIYPKSGAPPLPYETDLFWRVQAFNEGGEALGDPSPVSTFKTPSGIIELELVFSN